MIDTKALREKILDLAIRGKLVPQDPNDEPASILLERIRKQKQQMVKEGKLKAKDIKNDTIIFKGDDNLHYEQFQDGTTKCIEDEIPFDVPDGWVWCRLQTICAKEIKRGKAPKYKEKSNTLVFAQKCNTKAGFVDISKAKFLDQSLLKKYTDDDYLFYDDIIINSTGTGTLGRIGIFMESDDIYKIKIVPDSHITIVRVVSSEINAKYMYYFLKYHQYYFENSGTGSTNQKELKPDVISKFLVAIPPIREQNNIATKIDISNEYLLDINKEKEKIRELISTVKSKILDLAIRGKLVPQDPNDEPACVLLERIQAEKEELIKQGKIKRVKRESVIFKGDDNSYYEKIGNIVKSIDAEVPFDLPENWLWVRLSTIAINFDSSRKPINSSERKKRIAKKERQLLYPYYGSTGQVGFIDNYIFDGKYVLLGEDGAPFLDKFASKAYIVNGKVWVNNHVHILKSLISSEYLLCCLNSIDYTDYVYGTTRLKLTQENMNKIMIPVPPLNEQNRISKAIDMLSTHLRKIEESIN